MTDSDRQMHVSVGAARSSDRGKLNHSRFSVQWLPKVTQQFDSNCPCRAFNTLRLSRTADLAGLCYSA